MDTNSWLLTTEVNGGLSRFGDGSSSDPLHSGKLKETESFFPFEFNF